MSAPNPQIAAIRAFNRFYTRVIGLLNEGIMQSPFSLTEARVIHEIGKRGRTQASTQASTLALELGIDPGQMSRLVWRLSDKQLLASTTEPGDRRANMLSLTPEGDLAYAELNAMSDAGAEALVADLSPPQRQQLVASMQTIQTLLGGAREPSPLILRPHRLGELGWLIHRQAVLYNQEYGWNSAFESLIAKIYADFETAPQSPAKGLWIAEYQGEVAGSVFIVPAEGDDPGMAQLRMLYVEPAARGQGVGQRLVAEAVKFARDSGYDSVMLWTQDCLTSARRIYQGAGFVLIREDKHHSFGHDLNGQYWQLDFKG